MIDNSMRKLSFDMTKAEFVNRVRGLSPVPCAFCTSEGKNIKIFSASPAEGDCDVLPGTVVSKGELIVKVSDGLVRINELQLEGKKRMNASDFCRGRQLTVLE